MSVGGAVGAVERARFVRVQDGCLPEVCEVVVCGVAGVVRVFEVPTLEEVMVEGGLGTGLFCVGGEVGTDGIRVVIADGGVVRLVEVDVARGGVTVLGECALEGRVVAVAFEQMTVVASTSRRHCMIRVSRSGGLALAATVQRSEKGRAVVGGDGGAAVLSFFGGLFGKKDFGANYAPKVAFALPENRWLLIVDGELVAYSSFGAKLEELENVFKSREGFDVGDGARAGSAAGSASGGGESGMTAAGSVAASGIRDIVRSLSVSSFGSVGTGISAMTMADEAKALRAEKPPVDTVFSSPFVFSVTAKNELLAFAANGSIPGVLEKIDLDEDPAKRERGVKIIPAVEHPGLVLAYWPSGRVLVIKLAQELDAMIEEREQQNELRLALALVPADQTDRMITLRRLLAAEAREQEWHDAAIHHMQCVVNLSIKREGADQMDLVAEAAELRGPSKSGWQSDPVTATFWADFLFQLRRRVMRSSIADIDVLETLCRADESATRIKSLLSVKHDVSLAAGEALIASIDCALREEERVEALVALYTSLEEHEKALLLIENSDMSNAYDEVSGYLARSIRPVDQPTVFFTHLLWLGKESVKVPQGKEKFLQLVLGMFPEAASSEVLLCGVFKVLVETMPSLIDPVINSICPESLEPSLIVEKTGPDVGGEVEKEIQVEESRNGNEPAAAKSIASGDTLAAALLAGMGKADVLELRDVFDHLRLLFGTRILHREDATYQSDVLIQALQAPQNRSLALREELAFLLGRQGRHSAAADELAAEKSLSPTEAMLRLERMLPAGDKASVASALVAAYLRVSVSGVAMRIDAAADVVRQEAGGIDMEKVLRDSGCNSDGLTLAEMRPLLHAALVAGSERLRLVEILRALRKTELRRVKEEVLMHRRRCAVIGADRACSLCTRRIGDSVFVAYPDGTVAHLACHTSTT